MPKEDEIKVQIRERANDDAEYERPAIGKPCPIHTLACHN